MGKRIEFIDAMRGFAILLIIYSHILTFGFGADFVMQNFSYDRIIVMFMLPLFFFISGMFAYKSDVLWSTAYLVKYIKDKFIALVIPTTIILLLYIYIFNYDLVSSFFDDAKRGYWFTYSLFEFFLVYGITCLISNKFRFTNTTRNIVLVGSALLLLVISMPTVGIKYLRFDQSIYNLFNLPEFKYYVYFIMGIFVKQYYEKFQTILAHKYFYGAVGTLTLLVTLFFIKHGMYDNGLYNHIFLLIINISWLTVIFAFFKKNEKIFSSSNRFGRIIQLTGKRTLDIYLLHYFFLPRNMLFIKDFFVEYNQPLIEFLFAITLSFAVIFLSLLIGQLIRSSDFMSYYMLGVKPKSTSVEKFSSTINETIPVNSTTESNHNKVKKIS